MDYEKKYKEALKRAKILYNDKNEIGYANAESVLEEIFPLLKESDDERIKKEIISFIQDDIDEINLKVSGDYDDRDEDDIAHQNWCKKAIAWLENIPYTIDHEKREGFHLGYKAGLEKQGTPNQTSIWKHWKDGIAGNGEGKPIYLIKYGHTYSLSSCLCFECDYIELSELDKLMLEKQGEKSLTVDIESMIEAYEQRLINQGNGVRNSPIVNMCVAAFKHGVENTLDELHLKQGETSPILSNSSNIGKDEQKPAWSIKEKLMLNDIIETTERSNIFKENYQRELIDWLKSLKNRVLPQPKQEWSEEDEKMCQETIDWFEKKCFPYALENENPARESIKWLKSIKQKIGG